MTDYFVIAEGNVERHVHAISQAVSDVLQENNIKPLREEGGSISEWVALDYGNIVIHLFTSELREKYSLEQVWKAGKIVNVPLVSDLPHKKQ